MNKDYETSYPGNRYPYHYMDTDGSLISIRRMLQYELRDGAAQCIAEGLGLGAPKAIIRIDQTEDHDPDLYGYASRFVEAVEHLEIPIVAFVDDMEE